MLRSNKSAKATELENVADKNVIVKGHLKAAEIVCIEQGGLSTFIGLGESLEATARDTPAHLNATRLDTQELF